MSIIESIKSNFAYSYICDAVLNPAQYLPLGIQSITCRICHAPQAGMIYNRNMYTGFHAQQIVGLFMCDTCRANTKGSCTTVISTSQLRLILEEIDLGMNR